MAAIDVIENDPELRHSLRVIQRQRRGKQIGVLLGILAAFVIAVAYAYLSYSGTANVPH